MKIGFLSLGCPKNLVDSEVMLGLAREAGYELTADAREAEVLVVNTCAFIDKAKQESVDAILEMAELKKTGHCRRLVVTGCLAERYRDRLREEMPEIDAVLGTGEVPQIVEALEGRDAPAVPLTFHRRGDVESPRAASPSSNGRVTGSGAAATATRGGGAPRELNNAPVARGPKPEARGLPTYLYDAQTPRALATPGHYAYVKIAEGCDYKCAFCIIPTLRGHYRSRTAASIVDEARRLADRGVRELLLVSQDTTFYGIDRQERGALARLLRELNTIDGLAWIRLLYLYPTTIDDATLEAMAECDKVCRYVDLPLQHASDQVLRRMRRPGTRRTYDALLARIRARVPGVALRTTFIVGFPGETDDDLAELQGFVRDVRFDHVGVFTYSHEEGTSAFGLPDDVPAAVKRRRRAGVMAAQRRIVRAAQQDRIGRRVTVMVDGPSPEHALVVRGRLEGQAPDIDPCVYLTDWDPSGTAPGTLVEADIVGARDYDLLARPLP
ncbi:MAG: 30S ribosomal protein S12 methylthiotransferase RimO [Acidobacteriota bacterium]|nr:30S ribosomal protein S12 methylthiotransferase RimO [Acidobacteriota bacterium]